MQHHALSWRLPKSRATLHPNDKKFARIVKAGHRITGDPRDETRGAGWSSSTSPSTTTRASLSRPCIRTRRLSLQPTSWPRPWGLLPALRHRGSPRDHRQRTMLLGQPLPRHLPRPRHHAKTHPPLPAADQRQGRTLPPDCYQGMAYARRYENSAERRDELLPWTHQYNWHRPHSSLLHKPPISRSGLKVNNLLIHHT
jgi:hypothetical protein